MSSNILAPSGRFFFLEHANSESEGDDQATTETLFVLTCAFSSSDIISFSAELVFLIPTVLFLSTAAFPIPTENLINPADSPLSTPQKQKNPSRPLSHPLLRVTQAIILAKDIYSQPTQDESSATKSDTKPGVEPSKGGLSYGFSSPRYRQAWFER